MKELAWVVLSVILACALSYVFAVGIVSIGEKQIDFIINRRKAKQLAKRKEITQTVLPLAKVVRALLRALEDEHKKEQEFTKD